jgi:hypothetical protein
MKRFAPRDRPAANRLETLRSSLCAPNAMPTSMFPRRFQTAPLPAPVAENRFISEMSSGSKGVKMPSHPSQKVMMSFGFGESLAEKPLRSGLAPFVKCESARQLSDTPHRSGKKPAARNSGGGRRNRSRNAPFVQPVRRPAPVFSSASQVPSSGGIDRISIRRRPARRYKYLLMTRAQR